MNLEEYMLINIMEECAKIQHACSMALRFGLKDWEPGKNELNEERIAQGFIELQAVIEYACRHTDLFEYDYNTESGIYNDKMLRIQRYVDYAKKQGRLPA